MAHYENGVLSLALPKAAEAKGRTIPVQSGQSGLWNKFLDEKEETSKGLSQ